MTNISEPDPQNEARRFVIDRAVSRFTVQVFAGGLLATFGHSPIIAIAHSSGEADIAADLQRASLRMEVEAASLRVASEMSDKDSREIERMMHEQVLESDRFPNIVYTGSCASLSKTAEGQFWIALTGELTLHGVTRGLTIPARVAVMGDTLKASGTFSLLQSDYEIDLVSVAGGALKVKDELKFSFDILARKQG